MYVVCRDLIVLNGGCMRFEVKNISYHVTYYCIYEKHSKNLRKKLKLLQGTWRAVKISKNHFFNFHYVFPIYNSKLHDIC